MGRAMKQRGAWGERGYNKNYWALKRIESGGEKPRERETKKS